MMYVFSDYCVCWHVWSVMICKIDPQYLNVFTPRLSKSCGVVILREFFTIVSIHLLVRPISIPTRSVVGGAFCSNCVR